MMPKRILFLALILAGLTGVGSAALAAPVTITVTPNASGSDQVDDLANVPWTSLEPGSRVIVADGTYTNLVVALSQGTAEQPIVVEAAPGAAPVLQNSFVFQGASHMTVSGLIVEKSPMSGFIIQEGAHHITVSGNTIRNTGLGVWIGNGAGTGHRIIGNTILDNQTHGVAVDVINADPDDRSYITGNRISGSGYHGMEINGSWYVIEHNVVSKSGQGLSGTSGIHLFARDPDQDAGDNNVIRYNITFDNDDDEGQDGNGIQADQWCDNNTIAFNVSFNNDGAGIVLYDASGNDVSQNTVYNNARNTGGTHAYQGEIVVASDFTKDNDRARDNRIVGNVLVAARPAASALVVESTSIDNNNVFGPNLVQHEAGGPLISFGTTVADTAEAVAALAPAALAVTGGAAFKDSSKPAEGGLALTEFVAGNPAIAPIADIAGITTAADRTNFGAYAAGP